MDLKNLNYKDLFEIIRLHKQNYKHKSRRFIFYATLLLMPLIVLFQFKIIIWVPYIITIFSYMAYELYFLLRLKAKIAIGEEMLTEIKDTH